MRFLTTENGRKVINIDKISEIGINKIKTGYNEDTQDIKFVLVIGNNGFYVGDFQDVKLRYVNLIDMLSNADVPSSTFIPNNFMVVMKDDGTFICEENSLWTPEIKEEDFS